MDERNMATVDGQTRGSDDDDRLVDDTVGLDLDLDEIDDKEFDIPPVDNPPTLESILNAPDDDADLHDGGISAGAAVADSALLLGTTIALQVPQHFYPDYPFHI